MRQVLCQSSGALIARMPRPTVDPHSVLVRVRFSFISTGTETAALSLPAAANSTPAAGNPPEAAAGNPGNGNGHAPPPRLLRAARFLGRAARKPRQAIARAGREIAALAARIAPLAPQPGGGEPAPQPSDLPHQGWNVGYSCAGVIEEVGERIIDLVSGQAVACAGAGRANHADFVVVPRNLVAPVPPGVSLEAAATTTVGTIALQGVRQAETRLGDRVLILGLGLLGQITLLLLRQSGCRTIGFDPDPSRVMLGKKMGLDEGSADPEELAIAIRSLTGGFGVDRTIITASSKGDAIINSAMEHTRRKGMVIVVGDVGLKVERTHFYRKEIDLRISSSYGPGRYDEAYEERGQDYPYAYVRWTLNRNMQAYLELLARPGFDVAPLIEERFAVEEAPEAYRTLVTASPRPLSALLYYPPPPEAARLAFAEPRISLRGARPEGGPIRFVLVGAGAFGQSMLVPKMKGRPDLFQFHGVVSRDTTRGGNFARAQGVKLFATQLEAALDDPEVDLVVIATRHGEHAGQTVQALRAGKHVFVEKPLAITWQQLDEVENCYRSIEKPPALLVGFNRGFAPPIRLLREELASRKGPLMINYRLNGGFIPAEHWIQGDQGGGRNIGEACHFYDLFRRLAGCPVESIQARSIAPPAPAVLRSDNFVATLRYEDGSLANLFYTASGPKTGLSKEVMEVFCDGKAYRLEDFKDLRKASQDAPLWSAAEPDKGHLEELVQFGQHILGQTDAPIPVVEILESSAVALYVEDQLFERSS